MKNLINNSILKINSLLGLIAFIPESFYTLKAPASIDQDLLDEMLYNFQFKNTLISDEDFLDYFANIEKTLDTYLDVFTIEMRRLVFMEYTTPESVKSIMNIIGSNGVLNTEHGLRIYRPYGELVLNKTDFLVKNNDFLFTISAKDRLNYRFFINKFNN